MGKSPSAPFVQPSSDVFIYEIVWNRLKSEEIHTVLYVMMSSGLALEENLEPNG